MYDGYVFYCNGSTQRQCISNRKFSCQESQIKPAEPVKEGSVVFLFNPDEKTLLGPFTALTEGATELDKGTWAMRVDENIPSEDLKVTWEQLHILHDAAEKLPMLATLKACRLTSLETQNVLDTLAQGEIYQDPDADSET